MITGLYARLKDINRETASHQMAEVEPFFCVLFPLNAAFLPLPVSFVVFSGVNGILSLQFPTKKSLLCGMEVPQSHMSIREKLSKMQVMIRSSTILIRSSVNFRFMRRFML